MKRCGLKGVAAALIAVAAWAGPASAGNLLPDLTTDATGAFVTPGFTDGLGRTYVAGEGAAPNTQIGKTIDGVLIGARAIQHVDWIVRHDGAVGPGGIQQYTYFYQLENSSIFDVTTFTIGAPTFPPIGFFAGSGAFIAGADIDALVAAVGAAHTSGTFANLGPDGPFSTPPAASDDETEHKSTTLAGAGDLVCCQDPQTVFISSLIVNFGPPATVLGTNALLNVGEESSVVFATGTRPTYGNWNTAGVGPSGTPVSWSSIGGTGGFDGLQIPVPRLPAPSALALLGVGLLGSAFWMRRRALK
jgi:hypothetical protein